MDRERALAFITKHCADCHGGVDPHGQLILTKLTGKPAVDTGEALLWGRVIARVQAGEMPPKSRPKPAGDDVAALAAWVRSELALGEKHRPNLARLGPSAGNLVPHELLFGKPSTEPSSTDARIWRNRLPIYEDYYLRMLRPLGSKRDPFNYDYKQELEITLWDYSSPWGIGGGSGFKDFANAGRIDDSELGILIDNAEAAVAHTLDERKRGRKPSAMLDLKRATKPSLAQIQAAITEACQLVLLRKPSDAELSRYAAFFAKNAPLGHEKAVQTLLTAIFLHPESLYRVEVGRGQPDAYGRTMLAPRELARAIAFALTDRAPDAELLRAGEAGELNSPAAVRKQVTRLLNEDEPIKNRVLEFFREYFGYTIAPDVFKDEPTRKKDGVTYYWPQSLVYDTDRLIQMILKEDKDVLKELLTTRRSYVDYLSKPEKLRGKLLPKPAPRHHYSSFYGFDDDGWVPTVPVQLPESERAGILTQPSWLIAHSTNFDNHAIERGKWIREKLLGGSLPDIPLTVEAKLPDDPKKTLRERMSVTRQTFCWQCHQRIDPLGLAFEMFDHFGRHRTKELGQPVDAKGELRGSGDAKLDGSVKNAVELMDRLAQSERVRQVFVRHAFRYWMGRNETPADAATLQAADNAYVTSGGSMKALVTSLLTSDAFLYRRAVTK
jgi:hypothetical protein